MVKILDSERYRAMLEAGQITPEQEQHLLNEHGYDFLAPFMKTAPCGARCRDGHACKAPSQANGRCRNHGGLSTGPRTKAGRARISQIQRTRARHNDKRGQTGPRTPAGIERIRQAQYRRWARWFEERAMREGGRRGGQNELSE